MRQQHSIPPVFDRQSKILILGSFPSVRSRETDFFYGHPQNRFWRVLAAALKCELPVTAEEKRLMLRQNHLALWDVVASCEIAGSGDASIRQVVANDLRVITGVADIRRIFTNGGTADRLYQRFCRAQTGMDAVKLPSTSPANARYSLERLTAEWSAAIKAADILWKGSRYLMNETITNILERRSIRAYKATLVEDEALAQIVRCGEYAATGMGRQPWHFTVLRDRELMDRITAANRELLLNSPVEAIRQMAAAPDFDSWRGAPAAIIVSGDGSDYALYDCANATQNMAVAAKSLGLGSCYMVSTIALFKQPGSEPLAAALGIPEGYAPLTVLAVGYADEDPSPAPRKANSVNFV